MRITGNDQRGLLYGVGKFPRTSGYDRGGFTPGAWRGKSVPEKPVRGIYFATHFHNFYHDAPIAEVERYVEIASSLKARELLEQADTRLSSEARRAWRWRILLLRARINAQLHLDGGVARGRELHDACEETPGHNTLATVCGTRPAS